MTIRLALGLQLFITNRQASKYSEAPMNIKQILFATDFSECSNEALKYASNLASDTGGRLWIVHVDELLDTTVPPIPSVEGGYFLEAAWDTKRQDEVKSKLATVVPTVSNVKYDQRYLMGSPQKEILQFAGEEAVDLIVMGSHGRTGISRLLMGSVAEAVMRKALCPVLIVKQPTKALTGGAAVGDMKHACVE
jgi:nucleotide-binding universal stress UspA family protein